MPRRLIAYNEEFGRWTAIRPVPRLKTWHKVQEWECRCECGAEKIVAVHALLVGTSTSCGCSRRSDKPQPMRKKAHGYGYTRTYRIWGGMIQRCTNPKHACWARYGGRGIAVCDRWRDFRNFIVDMGEAPEGFSIERKDNDGNYEPGNCEWIEKRLQAGNKSNNWMITYDGVTQHLTAWARAFDINVYTLRSRILKRPVDIVFAEFGKARP